MTYAIWIFPHSYALPSQFPNDRLSPTCIRRKAHTAAVPSVIFPDFTRLILFLYLVLSVIIAYYAYLCIFDYRFGKLRIGKNIYAQGIKWFRTYEFYCPSQNVGEIKIIRTLPDRNYGTCNVSVAVRSESADSVTVRHLDYNAVKEHIAESYGIEV